MGGVLKTSYQSVSDTGNIQKTRKESRAPPTTEVTGLRAWLRMKESDQRFCEKFLRNSRRLTDFFPIAIAFSIILVFAGSFLSLFIIKATLSGLIAKITGGDAALGEFLSDYFLFIGIWIFIILDLILNKHNRPMFKHLLPNKKGNTLRGFIIGVLLGFGCNGFCVLLSILLGDIKLSYNGIRPVVLIAFMVSVFIQSSAEELVDRLFLYSKLRRRYKHAAFAIFVNAITFAAMHISNPGFTLIAGVQIFLVGLIFSLFVYYYDSLWAAMSFHATWNFTQNLIFGLPNSGMVPAYSIFKLDTASAKDGIFYNVEFGVEGSVGACFVLLALCIAVYLKNKNNPEKTDIWAPYDVPKTPEAPLEEVQE